MKTRFLLIAAAAVLLAGCTDEALVETPQSGDPSGKPEFVVGIGADLKTVLGDDGTTTHKVYWSDGDKIVINDVRSEALSGIGSDVQSTTFTMESSVSAPYNVVYPASIYETSSTVTLPAVQAYKAGGFASGAFPMVGYSTDDSPITLSYLCALLKVSINRSSGVIAPPDTDNIVSVRFSGNNGEQVSGTFNVNYQTATISGTSATDDDRVVRVVKNLATSATDAVEYYLVVPARTYSNGFTITVQDVNGHYMNKVKASSITLQPGRLYNLEAFDFEPTGTELGIEIASAADLVQFATDYNNKVYAALGDALVATVTQDIVFDATSSTAFNATGGIGMKIAAGDAEDYYFNGFFEGGNRTISGLDATAPLFTATGSGGKVQNLNVAGSCSFTFTHGNAAEADLGSVVGYHKGLLKSVTSAADVTMVAGNVSQVTALGGLVGRVTEGVVDDCSYSGDITVPSGYSVTAKLTHIGGLVGEITNAAGVIKDSFFNGTLETEARVSSTDKNNPYLFVGGIVGSNLMGTVDNCQTTNHPKTVTMANSKDFAGTILNHTTLAYHLAKGGIAGQNSGLVKDCTNGATIQNFVLTTGANNTANNDNSRYYDLGGVVGLNKADATVTGCTNSAAIESRSTPRIQKIGGVVGYNLGTVSSCSNESTGSIYLTTTNIAPYSVRVGEVGGAIGNNSGTVSDIQNAGEIKIDRTENATGVELKFGGVIGLSTTAIDGGAGKNISNSGNILVSYNGATVTTDGLRFGGIAGEVTASINNVHNEGTVTYKTSTASVVSKLYMGGVAGVIRNASSAQVSNCENEGEIFFNVANDAAHTDNYAGGIIGKTIDSDVAFNDCSNSGYIHGGNATAHNNTTMFTGGIVAYLSGISSIADCDNSGVVYNNQRNNTDTNVASTYCGGVAGYVLGTASDHITITDSDNSAANMYSRRGWLGGIVGYAEYASVSNCNFTQDITRTSLSRGIGGIVAWGKNTTITSCTFSGSELSATQVQANRAGGIVGQLDGGTVDGCSSHVVKMQNEPTTGDVQNVAGGAIVGISGDGNTILNCHYKDVINGVAANIAGTGTFTDGGGNKADL